MEKENLRPVIVSDRNETFEGFFLGWTNNYSDHVEGLEHVYKVAIIERKKDGQVIEVIPH